MRNYSCVAMAVLLSMGGLFSVVKADDRRDVTKNQFHGACNRDLNAKQGLNLSEYIWNGAVDLLPKAWNTTFIAGVAKGDMNPNFYGNYVLQDAVYCRIVAQLWGQLAKNASVDEEVREYASSSVSGYQRCSSALFDGWNVKDDRRDEYGVIAREAVMEYVSFIEDTMQAYPPNVLIATYACVKLWNNLTGDLYPIVAQQRSTSSSSSTYNPYAVWVDENRDDGSSARRQAARMDEWDQQYRWYDWGEALSLFRAAVMKEINFFDHAGNYIYV